MVVDDDPAFRRVLVTVLEYNGYEVVDAKDADEAIGKIKDGKDGKVDLVLTDYNLPGTNGIELARRLRILLPGAPVFLVTAYPGEDPNAAVHRGEVDAVITKPVSIKRLTDAIGAALDKTRNN